MFDLHPHPSCLWSAFLPLPDCVHLRAHFWSEDVAYSVKTPIAEDLEWLVELHIAVVEAYICVLCKLSRFPNGAEPSESILCFI